MDSPAKLEGHGGAARNPFSAGGGVSLSASKPHLAVLQRQFHPSLQPRIQQTGHECTLAFAMPSLHRGLWDKSLSEPDHGRQWFAHRQEKRNTRWGAGQMLEAQGLSQANSAVPYSVNP